MSGIGVFEEGIEADYSPPLSVCIAALAAVGGHSNFSGFPISKGSLSCARVSVVQRTCYLEFISRQMVTEYLLLKIIR